MSLVVSSQTLGGGEPRRCPVCRQTSWVEPSLTVGDAPCPCCGHLLWPRNRLRLPAAPARVRRTSARVGEALRAVARRVRRAVATLTVSAPAPAASTLYDPWLDG